jgi:hypothetical protein
VYEKNGYYDPHYGEGTLTQDTYVVDTGAQGWDAFAQDAYVVDTIAQGGQGGAWVNSDDSMAACLLYAIHEDERRSVFLYFFLIFLLGYSYSIPNLAKLDMYRTAFPKPRLANNVDARKC